MVRTITVLLLCALASAQTTIKSGTVKNSSPVSVFTVLTSCDFEAGTTCGNDTTAAVGGIGSTINCITNIDSSFSTGTGTKSLKMEVPTTSTISSECGFVYTATAWPSAERKLIIEFDVAFDSNLLNHSRSGGSCVGTCQWKAILERSDRGGTSNTSPQVIVTGFNSGNGNGSLYILNDVGNERPTCPVSSASRSGSTVTVTCANPHGMTTGAIGGSVTAEAFSDSTFDSTGATGGSVLNSTQFTYTLAGAGTTATSGYAGPIKPSSTLTALTWYHWKFVQEINPTYPTGRIQFFTDGTLYRDFVGTPSRPMSSRGVASMSRTSGRVDVTLSSAISSGYIQSGDSVYLLGNSDPTFVGACTVLASPAPTTTTFSCNLPGADGSASSPTGWGSVSRVGTVVLSSIPLRTVFGIAFGEDQGSSGNWEGIAWVDNVVIGTQQN